MGDGQSSIHRTDFNIGRRFPGACCPFCQFMMLDILMRILTPNDSVLLFDSILSLAISTNTQSKISHMLQIPPSRLSLVSVILLFSRSLCMTIEFTPSVLSKIIFDSALHPRHAAGCDAIIKSAANTDVQWRTELSKKWPLTLEGNPPLVRPFWSTQARFAPKSKVDPAPTCAQIS
jgi:hypothetical protein